VDIVSDDVKYVIREKVTEEINYENILSIKNVVKGDYGIYQCIVTNEKGEDRLAVNFADTSKLDFVNFAVINKLDSVNFAVTSKLDSVNFAVINKLDL
jgi:hypothetical protein